MTELGSGSPTIPQRPSSRGSDTESVFSSSQPASVQGGLYSANVSTLNLAIYGGASAQASSSTASLGGFNAISTVLNNPHKKQHPIDANSSRFAPLPTHKDAEIRKPRKESVQSYIDDVSEEWARYIRNRKLGAKGKARTIVQNGDGRNDQINTADASTLVGGKDKLPPLSSIPQVFFDETFNLGNPYTFDIVTERYGAVNVNPQDDSHGQVEGGSGEHYLDKLSQHSDVIEQHLLHEISVRSSSFFSALGTLQDLSQSSSECLGMIRALRDDLASIRDNQAKTGLQIVMKQEQRRMILMEMRGVERIHRWCQAKRMSELMVGQGEYEEALAVIQDLRDEAQSSEHLRNDGRTKTLERTALSGQDETAEDLVEGHEQPDEHFAIDLSRIPAIRSLLPDLDNLESTIADQLEADLLGHVRLDLESSSSSPEAVWDLRQRIEPLIASLVKTRRLERALTSQYRPVALSSIREALRGALPSPATEADFAALFDLLDDDLAASGRGESRTGEAGAAAAQKLRELTQGDFQALLTIACEGVQAGIDRLERQERCLLEILDEIARRDEGATSDQHPVFSDHQDQQYHLMPQSVTYSLPPILSAQLHSSIEVAHILIARLISLRASAHAQLTMEDFVRFFQPLMAFVERTERIDILPKRATENGVGANSSGVPATTGVGVRRLIPLRSTLLNQSKEWLRHFHRVRLEKAARWVEEETWSQADVPPSSTRLLRQLVRCAEQDPPEWQATQDSQSDHESAIGAEGEDSASKNLVFPSEAGSVDQDEAVKSYYVVPATLNVLSLTCDYNRVIINMDRAIGVTEIMAREIECLKQFNSRTCQVVLGAGAMRSAGLKNITAKHLALASQSLSLFIHLIPYLRECVRRHLPDDRQAVMLVEFDKLKRDFQEHMYEIHAKLVAIMGDRLSVHSKSLSVTDWNSRPANDQTELMPSKPIVDLVKETTTLHKVLSKYLQVGVVNGITTQVLNSIVQRVGTEYDKVVVTSEGGDSCQRRMQTDVDYLDAKLGTLRSSEDGGWNSESLRTIVSSKTAPRTEPAAEVSSSKGISGDAGNTKNTTPSNLSRELDTPPGSPRPGSPASQQRSTPAAYRSKMFPFGRRANTAQTQQQGSPQSRALSPRPATTAEHPRNSASESARGSIEAVILPAAEVSAPEAPSVNETTLPASQASDSGHVPVGDTDTERTAEPAETSTIPNASAASEAAVVSQKSAAEHSSTVTTEGPAMGDEVQEAATTGSGNHASPSTLPAAAATPQVDADVGERKASDLEDKAETSAQSEPVEPSDPPASDSRQPEEAPTASLDSGSVQANDQVNGRQDQLASLQEPADTSASPPPPPPLSPPSAPATPTKPVRLTLQQRLAEAARKRAAAASVSASSAPTETATGSETETANVNAASNQHDGEEKEVPAPPTPSKDEPLSAQAEVVVPAVDTAVAENVEPSTQQLKDSESEAVVPVDQATETQGEGTSASPTVDLAPLTNDAEQQSDEGQGQRPADGLTQTVESSVPASEVPSSSSNDGRDKDADSAPLSALSPGPDATAPPSDAPDNPEEVPSTARDTTGSDDEKRTAVTPKVEDEKDAEADEEADGDAEAGEVTPAVENGGTDVTHAGAGGSSKSKKKKKKKGKK